MRLQAGHEVMTVLTPASFITLDVATDDLGEEVPPASHQHGNAAAVLFLPHVGKIHARLIQEADARHGDVVFHVTRGAAREIGGVRLMPGAMFLPQVFRKPRIAVLAVAGPDVALLVEGRSHHFEGREGHALLFVDQYAPELHPR